MVDDGGGGVGVWGFRRERRTCFEKKGVICCEVLFTD